MKALGHNIQRAIKDEFYKPKDMGPTERKLYYGDKLTPEEAVGLLDKDWNRDASEAPIWEVYEYAHEAVIGRKRKCGNAEISHEFEVGGRAHDLGFGYVYTATGLLHDTIEAKSEEEGIGSVPGLVEDIKKKKFGGNITGDKIAYNVATLSNYYSILIKQWGNLITKTPSGKYTKKALREGLNYIKDDVEEDILTDFNKQFGTLDSLINELDINDVNRKIREDHTYSIVDDFKLRAYEQYTVDIFKDTTEQFLKGEVETYDIGIVVKGLDGIDNLRTMGESKLVMEKTLYKIETFLDYAEGFLDNPSLRDAKHEKFLTAYEALKDQLIEQLIVRRDSLKILPDTRYIPIREFVDGKINEYSARFDIDAKLIEKLVRKRNRNNLFSKFIGAMRDLISG